MLSRSGPTPQPTPQPTGAGLVEGPTGPFVAAEGPAHVEGVALTGTNIGPDDIVGSSSLGRFHNEEKDQAKDVDDLKLSSLKKISAGAMKMRESEYNFHFYGSSAETVAARAKYQGKHILLMVNETAKATKALLDSVKAMKSRTALIWIDKRLKKSVRKTAKRTKDMAWKVRRLAGKLIKIMYTGLKSKVVQRKKMIRQVHKQEMSSSAGAFAVSVP